MTNAYVISEIAEHDIDDIIGYIAPENPKAAHDFIDAVYQTFEQLAENPYMGHLREDLTNRPVRFWTVK